MLWLSWWLRLIRAGLGFESTLELKDQFLVFFAHSWSLSAQIAGARKAGGPYSDLGKNALVATPAEDIAPPIQVPRIHQSWERETLPRKAW